MIKGCNKRVIVMKETGNEMIEEAIFILKAVSGKNTVCDNDIVKHANSILEKSMFDERFSLLSMNVSKEPKPVKKHTVFFTGMAVGIIISAAVFFII